MKRVLTVFLAALMLLSLCVSAMAEDEIKIVMIGQQLGNVVFLDAEKGMNAAGEDLGVSVEWQSPLRAEAELQNEIMLNLISRGDVDGISISCTTGDALMASINAALDAGIQVVFTREGETADAYIQNLAAQFGGNYRVSVASSDGLVQLSALGSGVLRVSARELRQEIDRAQKEMRQYYTRRGL